MQHFICEDDTFFLSYIMNINLHLLLLTNIIKINHIIITYDPLQSICNKIEYKNVYEF